MHMLSDQSAPVISCVNYITARDLKHILLAGTGTSSKRAECINWYIFHYLVAELPYG